MEFCWFLRSVTFGVRFRDRFLGHDVFPNTNWHISSHLLLKLDSSLQRGLSLRN